MGASPVPVGKAKRPLQLEQTGASRACGRTRTAGRCLGAVYRGYRMRLVRLQREIGPLEPLGRQRPGVPGRSLWGFVLTQGCSGEPGAYAGIEIVSPLQSEAMSTSRWHLVRLGQPQFIASQRLINGDAFQFLPLFISHHEAEYFCRHVGLWEQSIRPRNHSLAAGRGVAAADGFQELVRRAFAEGVQVVGVFLGFSPDEESCWHYFRCGMASSDGLLRLEPLSEDERPAPG